MCTALPYVFCEFKGNGALINSWFECSGAPPCCSILSGLPALGPVCCQSQWVHRRKSNSSFSNHPSQAHADRGCAALPNQPAMGLPPRELAGCSVLASLRNTEAGEVRGCSAALPSSSAAAGRVVVTSTCLATFLCCTSAAVGSPSAVRSLLQLAGGPAPSASELSAETETRLLNSWV